MYLSSINSYLLEKYFKSQRLSSIILTIVCDIMHLLQVLCEFLHMHLITFSAHVFVSHPVMTGLSVKHVESFQENC